MSDAAAAVAALMRTGRIAEARAAAELALAEAPSDALLAMAGMLAGRAGEPEAAVRHFEALLARQPGDRATRINLAAALLSCGRPDRVEAVCASLAGAPDADRLLAFAAQQVGDAERAATLYEEVVAARPDDAGSWNNLGHVRGLLGRMDDAVAAFERAITLRRGDVRLYLNLAELLQQGDRRQARRNTMRDAAAIAPGEAAVQLALGLAEAAAGDMDAAESALREAIRLAPDDAAAYLELGLLLENSNRLEALDVLIADAAPRLGDELTLLRGWAAFRRKDWDSAAALAAAIPATINPLRRLNLQAEVADRCGDAAAAFAAFQEMNAAAVATSPPPQPGETYRAKVVRETAALVRSGWRGGDAPGIRPAPVFIVGFPRSGTTLIDTLLGALPQLCVLEEQPPVPAVEQAMPAGRDAATLDAREIERLRDRYFEVLDAVAADHGGRAIVDKHPLHMARMPIIHRLFPDARVLLVERHPLDVVLSCFVSNFQLNHAMRSFTDLEEAARTYDAVFTAWGEAEARLPLRVHRVRYERLVADTPAEAAAMLDFLGLDWDARVLDNQAAARARGHVRTASYAQVGEPIHQRSSGRWRRYVDQLAPVRPILEPWVRRLGYDD